MINVRTSLTVAGFGDRDGGERTWAKEYRWTLGAGKGRETCSALEPPKDHTLADTLILVQRHVLGF